MYDDFKHLKSSMKDRFTEGSPTWKSMALFPTPESLKNFLTSALSFLGDGVWDYEPMLNFLDNVSQKSFISEIKIGKLLRKVSILFGGLILTVRESVSPLCTLSTGRFLGNPMYRDGKVPYAVVGKLPSFPSKI